MKRKVVIIGAGGHGKVVADIARLNGYEEIIFLDDAKRPQVSGMVSDFDKYKDDASFVVAIGNNEVREKIQGQLVSAGCKVVALIHPNAVLGSEVRVGEGTVVMAGAVINAGAQVGTGVIVNTCSSIDHDCVVENFCHVSVGAHLAGTVHVKEKVFIGAGATVINNISICSNCMIGAGAVVVRNVEKEGIYIGVPARRKV